jgi:hypothetical protein
MARAVVSAAMPNRPALRFVSAALLAATLLSGCGLISGFPGLGVGAPGAADPGGPRADPDPGFTGGAGGGGGVVGGGGTGIGGGVPPGGGVVQPPGDPTIVVVHPGQVGLRELHPVQLTSTIDPAGHVIVRVRWWGGIEPCEVLDSVAVARDGSTFTIMARVGSAPGGQVVCIDIARDTATLVDLGVLASGRYTVRPSAGDATPIIVTVP